MFWKSDSKKPPKPQSSRSRPLVDDFTQKKEASREALDEINRRLGILSPEEREQLSDEVQRPLQSAVPALNRGDLSTPISTRKYEELAEPSTQAKSEATGRAQESKIPESNKKKPVAAPPLRRPL